MIRVDVIMKDFVSFVLHIIQSRNLLIILSLNDFKEQYRGSHLGLLWAILRPGIFVLTIWFIFSVGFKQSTENSDVPFILYLLCGYVPWFFFSEAVSGGMGSIVSNKYLVKKVDFRVGVLPIVKISSVLILHVVFLMVLISVLLFNGYYPSLYWLQLPYYIVCLMFLVLGLGWLTSSLRVFTRDVAQVVSVVLQLGFWVTPIFWQYKMAPERYHGLIQMNPMVYIVEGYRNTFLNGIWFWEQQESAAYFLLMVTLFMLVGAVVFKRLRPHFGDVL